MEGACECLWASTEDWRLCSIFWVDLTQLNTHTCGQDTGGSLIKVERPHTPHAICDERQHVTAHTTRHSVQKHMDKTDTNDQFTPILFVCDIKHGWYYGHKNKRSYISPPLSEMTILSEVMKDAWEQSSVIFTSSCDPEEQKRLNGNIKVNKNHLLVIINLTVRTVFLGKESQQNLRKGKAVVPLVWLLSDTPNGGTLWFR